MHVGIIAEGRGDQAVLCNVLKGWLGVDRADITLLRPEERLDETDLHQMQTQHFSNWGLVLEECGQHARLNEFMMSVLDERLLVIHLDTAESHRTDYPVERPNKESLALDEYTCLLCDRVKAMLREKLPAEILSQCYFAVAVEETDAWVLTLFEGKADDTGRHLDPKRHLHDKIGKDERLTRKLKGLQVFDKYDVLTRDFRKRKSISRAGQSNLSLRLFCESLPLLERDVTDV